MRLRLNLRTSGQNQLLKTGKMKAGSLNLGGLTRAKPLKFVETKATRAKSSDRFDEIQRFFRVIFR